jgi:hypothetical protein
MYFPALGESNKLFQNLRTLMNYFFLITAILLKLCCGHVSYIIFG